MTINIIALTISSSAASRQQTNYWNIGMNNPTVKLTLTQVSRGTFIAFAAKFNQLHETVSSSGSSTFMRVTVNVRDTEQRDLVSLCKTVSEADSLRDALRENNVISIELNHEDVKIEEPVFDFSLTESV